MDFLIHLVILMAAAFGLGIAFYIHRQKARHEKLLCPLDSDCDRVVHSDYSRLFGLPLELLGVVYYLLTLLGHLIFILYPNFVRPIFDQGLLAMTAAAFAFSLYLTGIQLFKLRQWCFWCLASAVVCAVIFFAVLALL